MAILDLSLELPDAENTAMSNIAQVIFVDVGFDFPTTCFRHKGGLEAARKLLTVCHGVLELAFGG